MGFDGISHHYASILLLYATNSKKWGAYIVDRNFVLFSYHLHNTFFLFRTLFSKSTFPIPGSPDSFIFLCEK